MKKIFLAILVVVVTTTFYSSCILPNYNATLKVQNVSSWEVKIYLDGKYLSTVYAKEIQDFGISVGSHNLKAVIEATGQTLQQPFSIKVGETYIYTIYKE